MNKLNVKNLFGLAIKSRRTRLDLTQEELAERANLHRTYITDIERGMRNVSLESIEKLAQALEVPIASLFGGQARGLADAPPMERPFSREHFVEILMVEDNPRDAALALTAFKRAKIANHLTIASDGAEALELLLGARDGQTGASCLPHMILLDLNLPKVDGREVLRRIKSDPRTRQIPVVVLTVSEQARDFEECRRLGAAHYLVKPVDFQSLSQVTPRLDLTWALLKPMIA